MIRRAISSGLLAACLAMLMFAAPAQAVNYLVDSTGDLPDLTPSGDGTCVATVAPPTCTLRAAIQDANTVAGPDVIVFTVATPATINLTGALPFIGAGGLTIQGPGPGPGAVTVRRDTGGDYRIFRVLSGAQLDLSGVTITNGLDRLSAGGGGIRNEGTLHLDGVTVTGNSAISEEGLSTSFSRGGGIFSTGQMSIVRSTIKENTASASSSFDFAFAAGGGVGDIGSSEISDSTISANHVSAASASAAQSGGGGVSSSVATKLTNVTVTGNTATASGSSALAMGGGAFAETTGSSVLTITSSTIASNSAASGANLATFGVVSISVRNTIVSDPLAGANCHIESGGSITSAGFNLASDTSCAFASGGDQQGVDPQLAALGDNGGPTLTRAPACGSPAIDQGSGAASGVHPAVTSDQRGEDRPVDLAAANATGGDGSDVGAVERQDACISPYPAAVLADTPTGYWRFGEPSGTTLLDSSGQVPADNGTYIGGVTLGQPGALSVDPNTAALYDGINDQGRVPDSNSLDVGNSFTAEGWIKRSSDAQTHELMNKGASGIQLVVMSAASLNKVVLRRAGVATIAQSTSGVPADGRFHHVVATMNGLGSTARIYIDGTDVTQVLAPGQTILNTAFPLTFGSFGGAPSQPATYDEFALYDAALSSARVQAHYAAGAGPH
jgi:hypothetical protein